MRIATFERSVTGASGIKDPGSAVGLPDNSFGLPVLLGAGRLDRVAGAANALATPRSDPFECQLHRARLVSHGERDDQDAIPERERGQLAVDCLRHRQLAVVAADTPLVENDLARLMGP